MVEALRMVRFVVIIIIIINVYGGLEFLRRSRFKSPQNTFCYSTLHR